MHLQEILRTILVKTFGTKPLDVIETGTIRGRGEASMVGDGYSTQFFAQWGVDHGGTVYSIDLNTKTVPLVLTEKQLEHVVLREGHSLGHLAKMREEGLRFDLAFLDSDNDPQLILDEFLLVEPMMNLDGLIIIDDVRMAHQPEGAKKGDLVWPYVAERGYDVSIFERHGWAGYRTGVLVIKAKAASDQS